MSSGSRTRSKRSRRLAELRERALQTLSTELGVGFDPGFDRTRYIGKPGLFAKEILGIDPWERQAEFLATAVAHDFVAVRSGHKVSKTLSLAILALYFLMVGPPGTRVVMTAPTARQVKKAAWREFRRMWRRAKERGYQLTPKPPGLDPATGVKLEFANGDASEVMGFTADDPDNFSGVSAPLSVYLVDEASGFDEAVYEALEGNTAGGAKIILTGNPTRTAGIFYKVFKKDLGYTRLHIPSTDSPNIKAGRTVIPGMAGPAWHERQVRNHGVDSAFYAIRVLGEFAEESANAVITIAAVVGAVDRYAEVLEEPNDAILELGVDPARFGDDATCIVLRRGDLVLDIVVLRQQDVVDVAGEVLRLALEHRIGTERPKVKVDAGGLGAGIYDILKRRREIDAIPVDSGKAANDKARFTNARAEMHFAMRDWLKDGGALPDDAELQEELVAPEYSYDPQQRIRITAKDELKVTLGRSPDRSDALALSIYDGKPRWSPTAACIWGL